MLHIGISIHHMILNGKDSRVNIGSTDQSINTASSGDVFNQIREVLDAGIQNEGEREQLKKLFNEMEAAPDQKTFTSRYQSLIVSAANHLTIIVPFLPALMELLKKLTS